MPKKYVMVHVILPTGERWEYSFPDTFPADVILERLASIKRNFGTVKTAEKVDNVFGDVSGGKTVPHADPSAGYWFDHPDTVVAIGEPTPDNDFKELKRLKGPTKNAPAAATGETEKGVSSAS